MSELKLKKMEVDQVDYNNKTQLLRWKKQVGVPFIVHNCLPTAGSFPSHTHGLTAFGEPEFFVNMRCFGPVHIPGFMSNGVALNIIYQELEKNPDLKSRVLDGETVEINPFDRILCLREVDASFAAVQIAYDGFEFEGMKFIQLYVKGDDFALTDEYYLAGEPF